MEFLHDAYTNETPTQDIVNHLGRSAQAIYSKASTLNLRRCIWIAEDEEMLITLYKQGVFIDDIAAHLGYSPEPVRRKAKVLGLQRIQPWNSTEDEILQKMYTSGALLTEIANKLSRSIPSIYSRAFKLSVKRPLQYSDDEIQHIMELRKKGYTYQSIADMSERGPENIRQSLERRNLHHKYISSGLLLWDRAETEAVHLLRSLGFDDAKRTHQSVTSQDPADVEYTENDLIVGTNVKTGKQNLSISKTNLERLFEEYETVEYLWKCGDRWFQFRVKELKQT